MGDLFDEALAAWRTHESINHLLLEGISDEGLAALPLLKTGKPSRGRNVARIFGHMVDARMLFMRKAETAAAGEMPAWEKGAVPSREELRRALAGSSAAVEARLTGAITAGEMIRQRSPLIFLGYLISHESHHRGQIMLALKQSGIVAGDDLKWGIWSKWFKD